MDSNQHLIISLALSAFVLLLGTLGYMTIEGWSLMDALYMTAITVSTVGFSEVHQVSNTGRVFTILLVLCGVGFSLYVAGAIVQFMVEGRMRVIMGRRRLEKKIDRLKSHYIVCGYGRIGRVLVNNLRGYGLDIVVIEQDRDLVPVMDADGVLYLTGDASDEALLTQAGIHRARSLIAALATDTANVFLVLTARQLNPDIYIMARASHKGAKSKLHAAGANQVESPYDMGAVSMASKVMRPTVTSFLELALTHRNTDIQMEEIPVNERSPLAGVMLKDSGIRQKYNVILIAIKRADGHMEFNPRFESRLGRNETVIAVGKQASLHQLGKVLNPS